MVPQKTHKGFLHEFHRLSAVNVIYVCTIVCHLRFNVCIEREKAEIMTIHRRLVFSEG